MANKHIKWFSSLVIREVCAKITIRYHFTPTKMAKIKRLTVSNVYEAMWRNWNSYIFGKSEK